MECFAKWKTGIPDLGLSHKFIVTILSGFNAEPYLNSEISGESHPFLSEKVICLAKMPEFRDIYTLYFKNQ